LKEHIISIPTEDGWLTERKCKLVILIYCINVKHTTYVPRTTMTGWQ